ncbi:YafY family transcriptional regulator [Methylobacterium mesophilicum SR1.6/6]|uniref:YafY family transcriptional regulator n=1 Tax=Methylobacterium mesophilicum SR1.6/6 TaxID=908290 RepID=A0A6B9FCR6_9HYPH|nr:YafY family protein [Methylobacterium mesophilicum]QGY00887.1 YafY family transcriptional regulator [Methylobacterium mesophilicum SR1.6/6]
MARSDRLFRLLHAMRVLPAPLTARRLAEETGVSLRSLYRDIDSLRAAGARIEGERGYGYRLTEDVALPPQTFDRLEIEALAIGMATVSAMGDPDLAKASASVLAKVAATLPDEREQQLLHAVSKVYRPEARHAASPDTILIREACWREEKLIICYTDEQGAATERTILPLAIVYTEQRSVVLAWCQMREAFRMFRLDRIGDARAGTGSFRPRRASLLRAYLEQLRHAEASPARSS